MSKVLTFIALSGGCVVPVFMDLGSSHLFNELWDEHARTHLVWMIASFFFIFILGSYFLFIEKNEVIPALMSLCVLLGYAISALTINFYGGVFLGEGGIKTIPDFCIKELRKLCDKKGILLILDEVQCGIGRSGPFLAFESAKVKPDIVPIAKGIGGGFPIGAVLMTKKVAKGMLPGTHGSTFGGNPLAMTVGNAVLDQILKKGFLQNVKRLSKFFHLELNKIKEQFPKIIKEVRGKGLLIGLQLNFDQTKFIQLLMENRLLTIRAAENVIRILPPLNVKKSEINHAIKIINQVCKELNCDCHNLESS